MVKSYETIHAHTSLNFQSTRFTHCITNFPAYYKSSSEIACFGKHMKLNNFVDSIFICKMSIAESKIMLTIVEANKPRALHNTLYG